VDAGEGGLGSNLSGEAIGRIEDDPEGQAHLGPRELVASAGFRP
jgi:hypothetical protein